MFSTTKFRMEGLTVEQDLFHQAWVNIAERYQHWHFLLAFAYQMRLSSGQSTTNSIPARSIADLMIYLALSSEDWFVLTGKVMLDLICSLGN